MGIEWRDDLSVGVSQIDNQHKELIKRLNDMLEACNQGKGKDEVGKIISFLGDYVVSHFSAEEQYMQKLNYPGFALHKAQHTDFLNKFTTLKNEFEAAGGGVLTVLHANRMLVDWLTNHIQKVDKELAAFLKGKI